MDLKITGVASHLAGQAEGAGCRVCVVTNEIAGATLNGGIGTACTSLVEVLAEWGHEVTVLFLGNEGDKDLLVARYEPKGIRVVCLGGDDDIALGLAAYRWLRDGVKFDVVHFPECRGYGFYSVQAKRCGLAFSDTTLCIGTHSSTEWIFDSNAAPLESHEVLAQAAMERASVAGCDVVLSPSRYLVEWMRDAGWKFPETVLVQPYVQMPMEKMNLGQVSDEAISELVFFGRLETRKGIVTFCDAVDEMVGSGEKGFAVTFLGREGRVGEFAALEYLEKRAEKWGDEVVVKTVTDLDREGALSYLMSEGRLAVMASPVDNSPNTVYEALGLGIPFIAARTGGIPELIHEDDVDRVTFGEGQLGDRLKEALGSQWLGAKAAVEGKENRGAVCHWHGRLGGANGERAETGTKANREYRIWLREGAQIAENGEALLRKAAAATGAEVVIGLSAEGHPRVPVTGALALLGEDSRIDGALMDVELDHPEVLGALLNGASCEIVPEVVLAADASASDESTYEELRRVAEVVAEVMPETAKELPMLTGALARQSAWLRGEVTAYQGEVNKLANEKAQWKKEKSQLKDELKALKMRVKELEKGSAKREHGDASSGKGKSLWKRLGG